MVDLRELAESRGLRLNHKRGRRWRGPCPICQTSPASQSLAIDAEIWNCHACGAKGGILAFYRRVLGEEPPKGLFTPRAGTGPDERRRIHERNVDVMAHRVAAARILQAVRAERRALEPGQEQEAWELLELEELLEQAIESTAGVSAKTARLYLDSLESQS